MQLAVAQQAQLEPVAEAVAGKEQQEEPGALQELQLPQLAGVEVGRAQPVEVGRAQPVEVGRAQPVGVGRAELVGVGRAQPVEVGRAQPVEVGRAQPVEVGLASQAQFWVALAEVEKLPEPLLWAPAENTPHDKRTTQSSHDRTDPQQIVQ